MTLPEGYILNVDGEEIEATQLRVYRSLSPEADPLTTDFTILGFRKESPSYERGRKTKAIYKCASSEDIIVEKIFTDIRDVNGTLLSLQVTFNWYNELGEVGLTKTEVVKQFTKYEAQTEERKRRERQLDYLIASGLGTTLEPYIEMVFNWYATQEQQYRTHGSSALADALNNETDESRLGVLNILAIPSGVHPAWPNGQTLREGILWQLIGGV